MQSESTKRKLWISVFILGVMTLTGCGVTAKRVVIGSEYQLNVEGKKNLGSKPAMTFEDRCAVLAETIVTYRDELGGKGIPESGLTFIPFAESTITMPDGQTQVLTVIYQSRNGVRILDAVQYGSYDLKKGELRTVRAFLKDPSKLTATLKPDMAVWTRMNDVFRAYLDKKGTPKTVFGIDEMPVMTAEPARAGYLARYGRRNPDGSLSRFAAIIDPSNDQVNVLYDMTND